MPLRDLKKHLNTLDKSDIIKLIAEMYKKVPAAKEYLDILAGADIDNLIAKYEKKIERLIFPNSKGAMRDVEARQLIREARKLNIPELDLALDIYYMECSLHLIRSYGYYDESFINTIYTSFKRALKGVEQIGRRKSDIQRIEAIIDFAGELDIELAY